MGFIAYSNAELFVSFRGIETTGQLFVESLSSLVEPKKSIIGFPDGGKVQSYFYDGFFRLWDSRMGSSIWNLIQDGDIVDITVTGHSLGGAMASIAAMNISYGVKQEYDYVTTYLYTFGEPRVGDATFARAIDDLICSYRIVNNQDIVAHLPSCKEDTQGDCIRGASPYHHGVEVFYEYDNPYPRECNGEPRDEDRSCSNSGVEKVFDEGPYIHDHLSYFGYRVSSWGKHECYEDHVLVHNTHELKETLPLEEQLFAGCRKMDEWVKAFVCSQDDILVRVELGWKKFSVQKATDGGRFDYVYPPGSSLMYDFRYTLIDYTTYQCLLKMHGEINGMIRGDSILYDVERCSQSNIL